MEQLLFKKVFLSTTGWTKNIPWLEVLQFLTHFIYMYRGRERFMSQWKINTCDLEDKFYVLILLNFEII